MNCNYSDFGFTIIESYYRPSNVSVRMKKYNLPDNAMDKVYIWLRDKEKPESILYNYVRDGSNMHIHSGMPIQIINGPNDCHNISESALKDQRDFFFTVITSIENVPIYDFPGDGKPEVHYYEQKSNKMYIIPRSYVASWKYI